MRRLENVKIYMLFNTITYLIFLPIVFVLYWLLRTYKQQNRIIVIASMVFYGWWSIECLALMIITCLINYGLVKTMDKAKNKKKWLLYSALTLNFSILGVFKYFNFFADNMVILLQGIGFHADIPTLSIILPVGISFYTFQLSGYVIDSYKKELSVKHELTDFLAFICFFPQLVAGPIERGNKLLPQFTNQRHFSFLQAREGMRLILWGLMKKMILADNCASAVDYIFGNYADASLTDLWLGALFFTFQIYGDFSGYSDIAIGSAKLFGINLSINFNMPYFSRNIQEFWRNWHITLMTWFKDYVYIPLGGNRKGIVRKQINHYIVFLLSGLWHGSNWTFILWGLYHAMWFIIPHKWITFFVVMIGWVIFRSPDVSTACGYINGMFNPDNIGPTTCSRLPLLYILLFVATEWIMKHKNIQQHPFHFANTGWQSWQALRFTVYAILFIATLLLGGEKVQFIYFQF